jgi:hypothetical protein
MAKLIGSVQKIVIQDLLKHAKLKLGEAAYKMDNSLNYYISMAEEKEKFCKELINNINNSIYKKKIKNKDYHKSVSSILMGKLFYISYKNGKYIKFKNMEKIIKKDQLISIVKEIESSKSYGWELVEQIQNEEIKDFLYGIYTYIYGYED